MSAEVAKMIRKLEHNKSAISWFTTEIPYVPSATAGKYSAMAEQMRRENEEIRAKLYFLCAGEVI